MTTGKGKDQTTNSADQGVDTHVPSRSERENMSTNKDYQPGTTGAVLSENDGRLKENRESGTTLGTTAHSAPAPHVERPESSDK